jgi:hypothetical protein
MPQRISEVPARRQPTRWPAAIVFAVMAAGMIALAAGASVSRATAVAAHHSDAVAALVALGALPAPVMTVVMVRAVRRWQLARVEAVGAVAFGTGFVGLLVAILVAGLVPG